MELILLLFPLVVGLGVWWEVNRLRGDVRALDQLKGLREDVAGLREDVVVLKSVAQRIEGQLEQFRCYVLIRDGNYRGPIVGSAVEYVRQNYPEMYEAMFANKSATAPAELSGESSMKEDNP